MPFEALGYAGMVNSLDLLSGTGAKQKPGTNVMGEKRLCSAGVGRSTTSLTTASTTDLNDQR